MHTHTEPPNMSVSPNVSARRLLQREHLAAGLCQECTHAPRAVDVVDGEECRRALCRSCRERQNAARRTRHANRQTTLS